MVRSGSAKPTYGTNIPGPSLPPTDQWLPSAPPSSGSGGTTRPFESVGKSTISVFGSSAGRYDRLTPTTPEAVQGPLSGETFKGIPGLEQASQLLGGVANVPAFVLSIPDRINAGRAWEQNAGPERAKWEALIANNAISQGDAEAQFRRQLWEQAHKDDRPGLFTDIQAPATDYSLGGQVFGGIGAAFSLIQRPWERATGGNIAQLPGSLLRGDLRSPMEQRLDSFRDATDAQLNLGGPHPELIDIRNRLKAGEINSDEAFDSLIVAGFGVSNPSGPLESLFTMITSDPVNLLAAGTGTLANLSARASVVGSKAVAREIGETGLREFGQTLAARGIVADETNLLTYALKDAKLQPVAEQALKQVNPVARFMILDAPAILRVGRKINGILDPMTLFGRDSFGVEQTAKFSKKLASGVINGYGASNYRGIIAKATTTLGDDVAEAMQDGFDRAASQIGAQVGNEQNIRHIRVTQSLDGIGEDATAGAMGSARRLGGDIERRAQDRVERTKLRIVPTTRGAEGLAVTLSAARTRGVGQVLSMAPGKVDRVAAERFVASLSEDELSLLDFQHYGKVTGDLIAARSAAAVEGGFDEVDRVTFIGPRQLTRPVLDDLKKAIGKRQMTVVRGMIERFDDLYRIYDLELIDDELLRQLKETFDQLTAHAPQTLTDISALPRALQDWYAKYQPMGYHLGLRPADDQLARPLLDKAGRIVGVNPWIDMIDDKTARQTIGHLQVLQRALFNNVSGASVVRDAQHRFIRLGAERFGLPETALEGLFGKVMKEASNRRTTARGLHPHEMFQIALDTPLPKAVRGRFTEREFAELVLEAHEGSLSKVGLTQKFTGRMKSSAMVNAGTNGLGVLAERMYPMLRFTLNPFFQMQELIETPFFMLLRGRIPMDDFVRVWSRTGRAEINDELDRTMWAMGLVERKGSFYMGDMMEQSMLTLHGNRAINDSLARNGLINRLGKFVPNVARMKEWGVARSFQFEQAKAMSKAMREASPESWDNFATWMAYRSGAKNDLDAVTSYMYDTIAKSDPDGTYARFGHDAFKPAHLGPQGRISTTLIRGLVYGEEEGKRVRWSKLLSDFQTGGRPVSDVTEALTKLGADPVYIQRAVDLVTTPKPDDFYKAFVRLGRPQEEVDALRQWTQGVARLRGISEHEQLSQMYAGAPASLTHLGDVKSRTMFQAVADSFLTRGIRVVDRDAPELAQMTEAGAAHLPDMTLPDGWETMKLADLTPAQKKARTFQLARQRRDADPTLGLPPDLTTMSGARVTEEQGRAIQAAYDAGDTELGQRLQREASAGGGIEDTLPSHMVAPTRNGAVVHRFGPVTGEQWWDMLSSNMDEKLLREKADWYPDMRRSFLALANNDPTEAARLTVLFAVSQLNTSPELGMRFIHRALAAFRRGEVLPIDQKFSGLNSAAIKRLLEEGQLTEEGMGQKLIDFTDSLLGKRTRTVGVNGPDELNPWMPAAADIWAKRDLGFIDAKMERHIGRVYGGKAVWDENVGFTVTDSTGRTFVIPKSKVTGGAPTELEYDHIVGFYNDRAREANERAFLDRTDWDAAEMQALGWFRTKFAMGDQTGSPLDAFHKNVTSVYHEVAPAVESKFDDVFPGQASPTHVMGEAGFQRGRITTPAEIAAIRQEGERIIADLQAAPRSEMADFPHDTTRAKAWEAVQDEWGGASFDSHNGSLLKSEAVYHGTFKSRDESIGIAGINRGDWINDVKVAKTYAGGAGTVYRTRPGFFAGGIEKAPGWFEGPRVRPENMEVLRDTAAGQFEPLVPGLRVGSGPFTTSLGDTTSVPIKGTDETAFNRAFDLFVENNRDELEQSGRYVGVFRNEDTGNFEFDVSVTVPTEREAEALQLAAGRTGGAYDHWTGNGVYAPVVGPVVDGVPEAPLRGITSDVSRFVDQEVAPLIGVQTLARFDGVGTYGGGLNPNAVVEVMGSPKDVQAYAVASAYLMQRESAPITRLAALGADASAGRFHAVDWFAEEGATYAQAEDTVRQIARGGASVTRYDDGSYGVRMVWRGQTTQAGTIPMSEFRAAVPDADLSDIEALGATLKPNRVVVESPQSVVNDYVQFPDGEGHLNWLRENGYASVADKLAGPARRRTALFYERSYRKHYAGGLDQWRSNRALDNPDWERRAGPLLDDLDAAYGQSVARDADAGPDLLGRAGDAAARGDALFQRHPRGTLGAVAFDAADGRARIFLNAKRSNPDTLLHELSHQFAEQALDPSGRKAILDVYNDVMGRRRVRPVTGSAPSPEGALYDNIVSTRYPSIKPGETKAVTSGLLSDADIGWFVSKYKAFVTKVGERDGYPQYEMTLPAARPADVVTQTKAAPRVATTTWTEDVHEWFAKQMIEWVRTGEAPARQIEPIFGYYSKFLTSTTSKVKMSPQVKAILDEITGRPVARAAAHNVDEEALMNIMIGEVDRSARNARDLIHFRTNRSWAERSLNHPYFGMYPLSYMWGKVLPELVEFLVFRPFGVKAPLVAYNTVGDIYRAVMLQQENDPELHKYLQDNEPALRAIAMLVPGVPWDLPVNSPLWMRRMAEAVATQQQRVLDGKTNPDGTPASLDLSKIDAPRIIEDTAGYALNPVKGVGNIVDSITGVTQSAELGANLVSGSGVPSSTPPRIEPPALTTETPTQVPATPPPVSPLEESLSESLDNLTQALTP